MRQLYESVKSSFKEILEKQEWLDAKTLALAKQKLEAKQIQLPLRDILMNDTLLNAEYQEVPPL